jgi:hypothetical protein
MRWRRPFVIQGIPFRFRFRFGWTMVPSVFFRGIGFVITTLGVLEKGGFGFIRMWIKTR